MIQTQRNTFVSFTFYLTLTLDKRKTLTKVSTRKTSHYHSPKQAHSSERENQQTTQRVSCIARGEEPVKSCLHNWWRIRSIRISSRNNGSIRKTTRSVLYKTLHYIFYEIRFVILLYGFTTVFCTKTLFSTQVKYY